MAPETAIAVVIATRNAALTLDACLRSVLEQRGADYQVVVVDGASTDGTVALLERYGPWLSYWWSEPDQGLYDAWNKAIACATAEWILFIGADDRLHGDDALARMAPALSASRERHRVVYGLLDLLGPSGQVVTTIGLPWSDAKAGLREGIMLPHPATFHHRSLFDIHGPFDIRYRIAGDYEFLLRELLNHDALFVPERVTDMASGGMSDRAENDGLRVREKWRARYAHGLTNTPEWRSPEVIRAMVYSWLVRRLGRGAAERVRHAYRRIRDVTPARPWAR
ncbi:MAG: glycosyltransferase family 2 protein [Chloroflexota bacterium]